MFGQHLLVIFSAATQLITLLFFSYDIVVVFHGQ